MDERQRIRPEWPPKDGAYDYVLSLNDKELAWEFLRRNSDYQHDALRAGADKIEPRRLPTGQLLWRIPQSERAAMRWGLCPFRRSGAAGSGCPYLVGGTCRWICA